MSIFEHPYKNTPEEISEQTLKKVGYMKSVWGSPDIPPKGYNNGRSSNGRSHTRDLETLRFSEKKTIYEYMTNIEKEEDSEENAWQLTMDIGKSIRTKIGFWNISALCFDLIYFPETYYGGQFVSSGWNILSKGEDCTWSKWEGLLVNPHGVLIVEMPNILIDIMRNYDHYKKDKKALEIYNRFEKIFGIDFKDLKNKKNKCAHGFTYIPILYLKYDKPTMSDLKMMIDLVKDFEEYFKQLSR